MDTLTSSFAEPSPLLEMVNGSSALQERGFATTADKSNAPVNPLTSPPRIARSMEEETQGKDCQQVQGNDRPPMSVVVVSTPSTTDSGHALPSTTISSSSSPFSAPFRLQPRGVMGLAVTKPGGRGEASRGRKRSAQSMSSTSMARDSLLTTKTAATPPPIPSHERTRAQAPMKRDRDGIGDIFTDSVSGVDATATTGGSQPVYGGTPPRGKRNIGNALINFQCLSLQSPKRNDIPGSSSCPGTPPQALPDAPNATVLLPFSSSSYACTPKRPAMVANSVGSFHSLATPTSSTMPPPRSSFTPVYSAASPGGCSMRSYGSGSIGSNSRINPGARAGFSPSGSTKSSPKIAPLTVLQDKGAKVLSSRESYARLPPRGMNSLWLSLESSSDSDSDAYSLSPRKDASFRMLPPKTVHCRNPSCDSISMVQNSILSSPGFPSPCSSFAPSAPRLRTPRSMQARPPRVNQFVSPKEQSPSTPQTPLPRVTLTPRSTGSRRSSQVGIHLPRFPSPSDADMDVTSPFLSTAAAASLRDMPSTEVSGNGGSVVGGSSFAAIQCFFPESSTSLALSADGSANEDRVGFSSTQEKKAPFPVLSFSTKTEEAGDAYMGIQTKSLLTASRSGGMLQAMMEEDERKAGTGDFGSVSDIDEDEGFILAAPSTIEEERFASCQPARQRRRRSSDRFSTASPNNLSSTSLAGMNYVNSHTSLFGMDIAHPTESTGILGSSDARSQLDFTAMSTASQVVPGLAGMLQSHNRPKSDASLASIGLALEGTISGRDLVTPPPMACPQMPPLLSPREGCVLPVMYRDRTMEEHRPNQTNVCIAGADRRSVTMAIAKMAFEAKHHSGSSPVL